MKDLIVDISKGDVVVTELYQYDYGQSFEFTGQEITDGTQIHFFQGDYGCRSEVRAGKVNIPDYLLISAKTVLAYLYIANEQFGETIQKLTLLILPREKPPDYIDPEKPSDYSRLLPMGGEIGDSIIRTSDGYEWKNIDDEFATDGELQLVSEQIPVAMTVEEILKICQ